MREYEELVKEYRQLEIPTTIRRDGVIRSLPKPARFNMYHVVVGMRRSGKSFYLYQMIGELIEKGFDSRRIFYFDFSDDRLEPITSSCGTDVTEEYYRQVPEARELGAYLFLDEVQELDNWQGLLKRLAQNEKVTLVVTGSSSKLSSEELGTKSRGRSHSHVLLPLSFREYCRFAGEDALAESAGRDSALSRSDKTRLSGLFDRFLTEGGFPGTFDMTPADRIGILQGYVRDVVARDVAERQGRSDISLAMQLARFALRNTGCDFSLNNLSETLTGLGYKANWAKLKELSELMQQAYLYRLMPEFTMQLKPSTTAVPKSYAIDQGLAFAVTRANQQDIGKRLETVAYLELVRRLAGSRMDAVTSWIAGGASREKIDFVVGDVLGDGAYRAVQVCATIESEKTRRRELRGLRSAMAVFGMDYGEIVTLDQEETIAIGAGEVRVVPAWRWLLR